MGKSRELDELVGRRYATIRDVKGVFPIIGEQVVKKSQSDLVLELVDKFGPTHAHNLFELSQGENESFSAHKPEFMGYLYRLCREKKVSRMIVNNLVVYYVDKIDEMEFDI